MTFKPEIIKELEINPNVSLKEIKKRFPNIADKTFYNYRTQWRKSKKGNSKGKRNYFSIEEKREWGHATPYPINTRLKV